MKDLIEIDMWNEKIKNNIIANNGSIQYIEFIPDNIKNTKPFGKFLCEL